MKSHGVYRKAILRVGTYHSPDGVVEVTPARLKHWQSQTARLQANKYAIPMHWDHSNEQELLEPIAMDALKRGNSRSAEKTVGRLEKFKVAPDGQSAEITVHTMTPAAKEAMGSNTVYVSPVIFPEWRDGADNSYTDVITSVDLVDHPVDHSQGQFIEATPTTLGCAIRMGLGSTAFLEGTEGMPIKMGENQPAQGFYTTNGGQVRPITSEVRDDDIFPSKPSKKWKKRNGKRKKKKMALTATRLAFPTKKGDEEDSDEVGDDSPLSDETPTDYDATPGIDLPEAAQDDTGYDEDAVIDGGGDDDQLDEVLILLQDFGITLPEDTTDENLMDRLRVSLTAMCKSKQDEEEEEVQDDSTGTKSNTTVSADPMIATMSLQARTTLAYAERQHRNIVSERLESLLKSGKCTPAEYDAQKRLLPVVRLSLNAQGEPRASDLEKWIDSRIAVPKGAFWDGEQKLSRMQVMAVDAPESWNGHNALTKKQEEEAVNVLLGKR